MIPRLLLATLCLLPTLGVAQSVDVKFKAKATGAMVPAHNVEFTLHLTPSAEELSKPGELQKYIDAKLRKGERAPLPGGVIRTKPFMIDALGGVIQGAGLPSVACDHQGGWRNAESIPQAVTYIVADGEHDGPLITLGRCEGLRIQDLGIQTEGVGIHLTAQRGWGNFHTLLDRVGFHGCRIAFEAGVNRNDPNGADVEFRSVKWWNCGTSIKVNHGQGVNFDLSGQTRAEYCDTFLHLAGGGVCRVEGLTQFGVRCTVKLDGGGGNLCPVWIGKLYCDREPTQPPPILLDAGDARGAVRIKIDGYHVSGKSTDYETVDGVRRWLWPDHRYVIEPRTDWVRRDSIIVIEHPELNGYAGGLRPASTPVRGAQ